MLRSGSKLLPRLLLGVFLALALVCFFLQALHLRYAGAGDAAVIVLLLAALMAAAFFVLRRLGLCREINGAALILAAGCIFLAARLALFDYQTDDYKDFLRPWVSFYRANGGFAALDEPVGNYNIPYLVFLALFSYIPIHELYLIKLLSVAFDLVLAVSLAALVSCFTESRLKMALCLVLALALPTVLLNGALWGQCDSIYGALAVLSLYLVLRGHPIWSMAAAGLSFAFKLQAIFLLPVFLLCLFAGKLKIRHLPVFPAVYIAAVSPAMLAGRPVWETLALYLTQADTVGSALNYNSPSIYSLFYSYQNEELAARFGILAAFGLCLLVFVLGLVFRRRLDGRAIVFAALVFVVGIPLLLPHMHDRYFFLADVLTLALAVIWPRYALAAPLASFASLLGYYAYLHMRYLLPMRYGFYALLLVLIAVLVQYILCLCLPPRTRETQSLPAAESE